MDLAQPGVSSSPRGPLRSGAAPPALDLAQPGPSPLLRAVGRVEPLMPVMAGMKLGTLGCKKYGKNGGFGGIWWDI